jgi:circadian clock protein KaiC
VILASRARASLSQLQQFIQNLGVQMTAWQATTFLIGEYSTEGDPNPIFTVADGVIWLRQSAQGNSVVRKMEIMKMRGQPTLPGLHTFRISSAGIHVFAPRNSLLGRSRSVGDGARLRMGVPALDEMMGGGLPRGFVAGRRSVRIGQSILASAFLAEGARGGETGVIAAFEQRPNMSRGRAMVDLIDSGGSASSIPGVGPVGRRNLDAADHGDTPAEGEPRRHRFALGLRTGIGTHFPRRLS